MKKQTKGLIAVGVTAAAIGTIIYTQNPQPDLSTQEAANVQETEEEQLIATTADVKMLKQFIEMEDSFESQPYTLTDCVGNWRSVFFTDDENIKNAIYDETTHISRFHDIAQLGVSYLEILNDAITLRTVVKEQNDYTTKEHTIIDDPRTVTFHYVPEESASANSIATSNNMDKESTMSFLGEDGYTTIMLYGYMKTETAEHILGFIQYMNGATAYVLLTRGV